MPPAIAPRMRIVCRAHGVRVALQRLADGTIATRWRERHSVDEYLETIYFLAFPIGEYTPHGAGSPPLASRVAEMLGVSRASAGEMLKRLEAEGLIERGERKEALLTKTGRAARRARRAQAPDHRAAAHRLHGLHRRYEAHERADELGDTFTDEMIERIDEQARPSRALPARLAGRPGRRAGGERRALTPLAALEPGTRATIVRLAEHDGELLHWFYDQGLVPGPGDRGAHAPSLPPTSSRSTLDGGERARSARRPPPASS